jgi:hypothetical protein
MHITAAPHRRSGQQNDLITAVRSMRHEEDAMACEVDEEDEVIAACALCPNEDCGSVVVSYRARGARNSSICEFACRCGTEFSVPEQELVLQTVPMECLLEKLPHMASAQVLMA